MAMRNFTEKNIVYHRQQEQKTNHLESKLKAEFFEKTQAQWENKGQDVINRNHFKKQLQTIQEYAKLEIAQRRIKLGQKLQTEHEQYKIEIRDLEDTPMQVREKMRQELSYLKEKKDTEREQFVAKQRERLFFMNTDEIRKVDVDFKQLQTAQHRNLQIMEKQKNLEQEYEEEMIYAKLYEIDIQNKDQENQMRIQKQKQLLNENVNLVKIQQEQMNQQKYQNQQNKLKEQDMMKQQWQIEAEQEQLFEKQKQKEIILNNQKIIQDNQVQQKQKQMQKELERQQDKEMIQKVIEKERAEELYELQQKQLYKENLYKYMSNFQKNTDDIKEYEKELDRQLKIQNDIQWEKRIKKWQDEEEARVKLLYEVYDSRAEVLKQNKIQKDQQKIEIEKEKQIYIQQVQDYEKDLKEDIMKEFQKNKKFQGEIVYQIQQKNQERDRLIYIQKQEDEKTRLNEQQLRKKIENEQLKGKELLDVLRNQRPF